MKRNEEKPININGKFNLIIGSGVIAIIIALIGFFIQVGAYSNKVENTINNQNKIYNRLDRIENILMRVLENRCDG